MRNCSFEKNTQESYRRNENKLPTDDKCFAFDTTPSTWSFLLL